MNEGLFHFILDFAEREPLAFVSILVGIPVLLLFFAAVTVIRVHPVIVWFVLTAALFGYSQIHPENRDQRFSIATIGSVISAVAVWGWFERVAPELREKLRRGKSD